MKYTHSDWPRFHPGEGIRIFPCPVPWDEIYLKYVERLTRNLGEHLRNKGISYVLIIGPALGQGSATHVYLPRDEFEKIEYTKEKFVNAWYRIIRVYDEAYPEHHFAIALHDQFGEKRDQRPAMEIRDFALKKLGKRFHPMLLSLTDKSWFDMHGSSRFVNLVLDVKEQTSFGLQMGGSWAIQGFSTKSFGDTLRKGIKSGAAWIEIHRMDVETPPYLEVIKEAYLERLR